MTRFQLHPQFRVLGDEFGVILRVRFGFDHVDDLEALVADFTFGLSQLALNELTHVIELILDPPVLSLKLLQRPNQPFTFLTPNSGLASVR